MHFSRCAFAAVALAHCLTLCHHSKRRTLIGQRNCIVQSRKNTRGIRVKCRNRSQNCDPDMI